MVCGTDTLGVGINVPIRTVLITSLSKYDGRRMRLLRAREFHQIAGRAGRAGFDIEGIVVVQAPEHEIENERLVAKAGDDPKKRAQDRAQEAAGRGPDLEPGDVRPARRRRARAAALPVRRDPRDAAQRRAPPRRRRGGADAPADRQRRGARSARRRWSSAPRPSRESLLAAGVLEVLDPPDADGRTLRIVDELQVDFALNQPLSTFALAAIELLDRESETYALDVLSVIESTLEDPRQVLFAQQFRARGEAVAAMKAEGIEYEERMELLEEVTWPKPLADLLEAAYEIYAEGHPWVTEYPLRPKSVARELYELAMTFVEYVGYHRLAASEGLVLRYLADAYKALQRTVPEEARTEELADLTEWLGELVRQVDSSLLDEWERLLHPEDADMAAVRPAQRGRRPAAGHRQRAGLPGAGAQRAVPPGRAGRAAPLGRPRRAGRGVRLGRRPLARRDGGVLRRARGPGHRARRRVGRCCCRSRSSRAAGGSGRSSTTPTATTTGGSAPRSTWPPATPRGRRSCGWSSVDCY